MTVAAILRAENSNSIKMKKIIGYVLITSLLVAIAPKANSVTPKAQGKLGMIAILSGVAILTRYLVKRDIRASENLRTKLGPPDRIDEYERGFDRWRVQWHGDQHYLFRNNLLYKISSRNATNDEGFTPLGLLRPMYLVSPNRIVYDLRPPASSE